MPTAPRRPSSGSTCSTNAADPPCTDRGTKQSGAELGTTEPYRAASRAARGGHRSIQYPEGIGSAAPSRRTALSPSARPPPTGAVQLGALRAGLPEPTPGGAAPLSAARGPGPSRRGPERSGAPQSPHPPRPEEPPPAPPPPPGE